MGILSYLIYFVWRHRGKRLSERFTIVLNMVESKGSKHDTSFVFFCIFGTIYSLYALLWVSFGFSGDKPVADYRVPGSNC